MSEQWKDIPGYAGLYQVSNMGNVKSLDRRVDNGQGGTNIVQERILKPICSTNGYAHVSPSRNGKVKNCLVHRLVLMTFNRMPEDGEGCNHINGVKDDNRIENLEWTTQLENIRHAIDVLGKDTKGEGNGHSKLTEADVLEIRKLHATGRYLQRELGKMFGVDKTTIGCMVRRDTWTHI